MTEQRGWGGGRTSREAGSLVQVLPEVRGSGSVRGSPSQCALSPLRDLEVGGHASVIQEQVSAFPPNFGGFSVRLLLRSLDGCRQFFNH